MACLDSSVCIIFQKAYTFFKSIRLSSIVILLNPRALNAHISCGPWFALSGKLWLSLPSPAVVVMWKYGATLAKSNNPACLYSHGIDCNVNIVKLCRSQRTWLIRLRGFDCAFWCGFWVAGSNPKKYIWCVSGPHKRFGRARWPDRHSEGNWEPGEWRWSESNRDHTIGLPHTATSH